MGGVWRNWGRTVAVRPQRVERPPTVAALQRAVQSGARRGLRVKAVGSGHSFSAIAAAPDVLLDLADLRGLVSVDRESLRVTVLAGTTLRELSRLLVPHGLALANLGDIDRQTVAGAISTGTHGTGIRFRGLAAQVVGLTLVTADGELLTIDERHESDLLPAAALGLGALGIIADVTIQCVPAFVLSAVERPEPLADVVSQLDRRADASDHFEFYWFPHTDRAMTKTNARRDADESTRPLTVAGRVLDDIVVGGAAHQLVCSAGRAVPPLVPTLNRLSARVWGDRTFSDASHRVFTAPRPVRFRETEYALPVERIADAFAAVRALIDERRWRIGFPIEVRFAAADDVWLSTAYGRTSAYVAVHRYWRDDPTDYFAAVEDIMLDHGGRPHWGKMHSLDAHALRALYPRFDDFVAVRERLDPDRRFGNDYLARVLGD